MDLTTTATQNGERISSLDFLRGIAVLGIFVINIESFAFADGFSAYRFGFDTELDRDFRFITYVIFQGKFFSMFALLFGIGFYLFLEKAARHGQLAADLYAHRLFWLFVFGVLHATLLWPGDILYHYAVCGLLLLPAHRLRLRYLTVAIVVLSALIGWQIISSTTRLQAQQAEYEQAIATPIEQRSEKQASVIERWETRYSPRTPEMPDETSPRLRGYLSNVAANIDEVKVAGGQIYYRGILFRTLWLMLTGVLLYRLGVFHDYRKLKGYGFVTASMLALGLAVNYSHHWAGTYQYFKPVTHQGLALAHGFSKELLGIAYLLTLNGLYQKTFCRFSVNPLISVGRMALSNYLLQSVLAGLIFFGYGIGLHGNLTRSELWPIVLAVWCIQLPLSTMWLRRYQQGPMEALWRRLMYSSARIHVDSKISTTKEAA